MVESRLQPGDEHYLTPGRHIQLIGSQNGSFTAFGHHVPHEMGGIWMHPIKLLDGFWFGIASEAGDIDWLTDAVSYSNHVFYNVLTFEREGLTIRRVEYSAQSFPGLIVEFSVTNTTSNATSASGVVSVQSDLRPVWSEPVEIIDAPDEAWDDGGDFVAKDREHEWFARCRIDGAEAELSLSPLTPLGDEVFGPGVPGSWSIPISIAPGETTTFSLTVTGSLTSAEETLERMNRLAEPGALFQEKRAHYEAIVSRSALGVPDKELEKQYAWSKCHIEWLTITSEPVGTGLAAGIPEYVWWFSVDSAYALKGCLPAGFHDLAEQTLAILDEGSMRANGNGRIIHEENSYGEVSNPGNAQETALFVHAVYETYRWTGDREWVASYWPAMKAALRYLLDDQMTADTLFPYGNGVMEGCGLTGEVIDTAVYTQVALADASAVASLVGDEHSAAQYAERAEKMASDIRVTMWLEDEGLFADVRAPGSDVLGIFDELIASAHRQERPELVERYTGFKSAFVAKHANDLEGRIAYGFKNWVIDTPLEMKIATAEQAAVAFTRLNSPEFVGEWGTYLSGDGDDRIMTISTAVHINSNLAYGDADTALDLIHRVMATSNQYLPGSISEMSPDYGCFVQAWSAYAMISPIVVGFLGLQPDAGAKQIRIEPCLPSGWNYLTLNNVPIGQSTFDFELNRTGNDRYSVVVHGDTEGWTLLTNDATVVV